MRSYLVDQGIPRSQLFLDHAGFDTYSSVWRARNVFGATRIRRGWAPAVARAMAGPVSTLEQSFETICTWMRANNAASIVDNLAPGASPAALAAGESMFGFPITGDLAVLWALHDGQREEEHGFVEYYDLCSMQLARVSAEDIYFALEMIRDGKEVTESGLTEAERTSKKWVRLAARDSDGYAVNAESGRVFALEHDEVPPLKLVAPSVSAWLADYAARVVAGAYEVEDGLGDVYLSLR